ncbi:hypothetical protein TRV_01512 [Trichophyton verrucosum HKI 0517]|uniref:Uncharacterized protein n=1 Tax=Trichophyton verrucosum (strain HKI 0517) TaxID=663202 RepID=D4D355_TRIVH|nr:uncharacterized protein TRV_01512 [Trichophyton verrucosum HKI 0517]EFE43703.1 hypothetical protein TRV_01512 [Trichophyton verrucosum HKI 0517]
MHHPASRKQTGSATFPTILEMDASTPSTDQDDLEGTGPTGIHMVNDSFDTSFCRDSWADLRLLSEGIWLKCALHPNNPLEGNGDSGWRLIYSPVLESSPTFEHKSDKNHYYSQPATLRTSLDSSISPSASTSTLQSSDTSISTTSVRKKSCIANLRSQYSFTMTSSPNIRLSPAPPHSPVCSIISRSASPRAVELVQLLDHLSSFCVLDTKSPGNAVVAASKDIYSAGGRGEKFPLNINVLEEEPCPVVSGYDENGNDVSYLIIATRLITATSGECHLLLTTLLDITDFLYAATLEDLELRQNPKVCETERGILPSINSRVNLSAAEVINASPNLPDESKGNGVHRSQTPMSIGPSQTTEQLLSEFSQTTEQLLSEFSAELLYIYKDIFILARSLQDSTVYKISHVSRSLHAEGEYIRSHLKHTPTEKMKLLSESLGKNTRFDMVVNWGDYGVEKRLYCVPIYCGESRDWVCTMTDVDVPYLWRRSRI